MVCIGLPLGIISAKYRNGWIDNFIRIVALLGVSAPSFVWAVILMLLFAFFLPIFPIAGRLSTDFSVDSVTGFLLIDTLLAGQPAAFLDAARHIFLPAFALSLSGIGQAARLARSNMVETYGKPYIEMAASYGFPEWRVATRYAFKPSLIPSLTIIGLDFAAMLGNAFLVEAIFAWPGLSRYGVAVILRKDLNAIIGTVLVISAAFLIAKPHCRHYGCALESQNSQSAAIQMRRAILIIASSPLSIIGVALISVVVLSAVFADIVAPFPEHRGAVVDFANFNQPPRWPYIMGTDLVGRRYPEPDSLCLPDILDPRSGRAGAGWCRWEVAVGLLAGYLGGFTRHVLMRVTDVFLSIPPLVLAMSIMGVLEPTLTNGMIAVTVMWWPWYSRLVYNITLAEREEGYVLAAEIIGASKVHIMFREILPNCLPAVITKMTLDLGFVILIASSLSFLGLGVQPPTPDLGSMVAEGSSYLPDSWWLTIFPGLAILVAVFGFNLLGDTLRELLGTGQ